VDYVKLLAEHGGSVNARNRLGSDETPLHVAVIHGEEAVARMLVLLGADVHLPMKGSDGSRILPATLARRRGHERLADFLEESLRMRPSTAGRLS
jgi:ankyrin repeat protein